MGLDISHGGFSSSYSTFNNYRRALLKQYNGMDLFQFKGFEGIKRKGEEIIYKGFVLEDWVFSEGLLIILNHSDCGGLIECKNLNIVAESLKFSTDELDEFNKEVNIDIINACELAYHQKQDLIFS